MKNSKEGQQRQKREVGGSKQGVPKEPTTIVGIIRDYK
jgi:hypothetical protein